jgi:putative ABC transport system permease protein
MSWISRLVNVLRSGRLDRDLDSELLFHIEARTDELIAKGLAPEDAAREARRHFGNQLLLRESSREIKLFLWIESVLQDVRFGLRMLRKNSFVTAVAVLSLSLAIGACAAAFSLIDAFFLRPLPVRDPSRLVYLLHSHHEYGSDYDTGVSWECLDRLREASRGQMELLGNSWGWSSPVIFDDSGGEEEWRLQVQRISGDGWRILGIRPALGRMMTAADDGQAVAVLSFSFWTQRFGASPTVVGRWFQFEGKSYQIVGVAQKGFGCLFQGYRTALWIPKSGYPAWEMVWGHLKPGVEPEHARQVLQAAFTNFRREHPGEFTVFGAEGEQLQHYLNERLEFRRPDSVPTILHREWERPLWILAVVAGLVLLIACSNVANLLVARAVAREREMALRISIGAGRRRLMQQMLIESGLVAGAACILGLAFAYATAPSIVNLMLPSGYPAGLEDLHLDLRILPFLALIGALTTALFGLAPALRASAVSPQEALKSGGAKQPGRIGILRPLLASQVGFSFTVLFVSGLLLLSFRKLTSVELGFSKDGVLLADIEGKIPDGEKARLSRVQLLDYIRGLPGVHAASISDSGLIDARMATHSIRFPGREPESVKPKYLAVSPGFFDTMHIRLLAGRDFTARDEAQGSTAVIVNEAFARQYLPRENPLGRRFEKVGDDGHPTPQEIVGVVRDAKYNDLREPNGPTVHEPMHGVVGMMEVRTEGNPLAIAATIRQAIRRVNPALGISTMMLQSTRIDNALLRERLMALLAGFFAIVAVVLAAIGLYGVLSYSVVRRTKEIGIRVALGARQLGVVRLVISDVMLVIAIGLAIGIGGGFALGRFVSALLFEVKASDFWSLALPLACFLLASALAGLPPAFRAARVDPIVALREE